MSGCPYVPVQLARLSISGSTTHSSLHELETCSTRIRCCSFEGLSHQKKRRNKIIDVAAGTGLAGVELSKLGYTNIDALDMSQEMLNQAKKKNVYQRLICSHLSDQRTSEIDTGQYDAITCVNALGN